MKITNEWFYANTQPLFKIFLIYIRGDAIVLLPFVLLLGAIGIFSVKLMFLSFAVFLVVRHVGEMIYWLLQQFVGGKYRPYDYGLKDLDNNAIYILYQLTSLCWIVIGISAILYILFI